jgi:hypothetical protein
VSDRLGGLKRQSKGKVNKRSISKETQSAKPSIVSLTIAPAKINMAFILI